MEWYAAYGLMVALIWLYLEILKMLIRIAATDDNNPERASALTGAIKGFLENVSQHVALDQFFNFQEVSE